MQEAFKPTAGAGAKAARAGDSASKQLQALRPEGGGAKQRVYTQTSWAQLLKASWTCLIPGALFRVPRFLSGCLKTQDTACQGRQNPRLEPVFLYLSPHLQRFGWGFVTDVCKSSTALQSWTCEPQTQTLQPAQMRTRQGTSLTKKAPRPRSHSGQRTRLRLWGGWGEEELV